MLQAGPGFALSAVGQGLCPTGTLTQERSTSWPPGPRGDKPPGQPGFSIQTCEEEDKEALYAAAIATLDFSFIPKHELSSQSQTGFLISPGRDEKPEKERQCLCKNSSFTLNNYPEGEKQQGS